MKRCGIQTSLLIYLLSIFYSLVSVKLKVSDLISLKIMYGGFARLYLLFAWADCVHGVPQRQHGLVRHHGLVVLHEVLRPQQQMNLRKDNNQQQQRSVQL